MKGGVRIVVANIVGVGTTNAGIVGAGVCGPVAKSKRAAKAKRQS
jgi:hypothetical protein